MMAATNLSVNAKPWAPGQEPDNVKNQNATQNQSQNQMQSQTNINNNINNNTSPAANNSNAGNMYTSYSSNNPANFNHNNNNNNNNMNNNNNNNTGNKYTAFNSSTNVNSMNNNNNNNIHTLRHKGTSNNPYAAQPHTQQQPPHQQQQQQQQGMNYYNKNNNNNNNNNNTISNSNAGLQSHFNLGGNNQNNSGATNNMNNNNNNNNNNNVSPTAAKLFVGQLPFECTEERLRHLFSAYGHVEQIHILKDNNNRSRGAAFITFSNVQEADTAIFTLHNRYRMLTNRAIQVSYAKNSLNISPFGTHSAIEVHQSNPTNPMPDVATMINNQQMRTF